MSTELREQWEQLYLPLRPLCTNDFIEGVYRQPRAKALEGYRSKGERTQYKRGAN